MHELLAFADLGVRHILGVGGADHLLFLLVLAAGFQPGAWRAAVWTVSAFTIGHSLALALAVTGLLPLPGPAVEILIPLTIVAAAIQVIVRGQDARTSSLRRALLAGGFGTIHGAGFAGYLRQLFEGGIGIPLAGFNLGIELAQLVVLAVFTVALRGMNAVVTPRGPAVGASRVGVSVLAAAAALVMAAGRLPW